MVYETVTDLDQLLDRIRSYHADADLGLVRKAYEFSAKAHEGQIRRSGEPYLRHPIAVAGVLTSLKTDVTAIVAALLHDTLEDTVATPDELEREFGKDVVHLVDGVTKIGKITFRSYEEKQAENFRKMVLSMADDIRVVLIKLADRLHNMRTLEHLSAAKRQEIGQETLEIYAPLANRLGIGWIKNDTKMNCYALLGVIHSAWRPVPGRFKDYIAIPKSNLYQSLHTTVVGPKGEHVEFQIRTEDMHRIAEHGIAAHWKYKEQGHVVDRDSKAFGWLHQFVEWHEDLTDNRQFIDSVKLDLFHDVVYVFTPKGIVKELPRGSTPVDFAFAIHTEVGGHCVGAKVDGKIVPLKHQLASGDTVEILTSSTQSPHKDWLKLVRTSRAKTKIKHWVKLEEQKRSIEIGRRLLESEFRRQGMAPARMFKSAELLEAARQSGFDSTEELTAAVGFGRVATSQVIGKLTGPSSGAQAPDQERPAPRKAIGGKSDRTGAQVKGSRDLLMQLSRCCHPVPGDRILGYITRGRGLTIHAVDCPNLEALDYDKERLVEVEWDAATPSTHSVKVSVMAVDKTGVLASVSSASAACHANISRAEITTREDQKAVLDFVVEVSDTHHLDQVLKAVERVDGVITARRLRAWQERS